MNLPEGWPTREMVNAAWHEIFGTPRLNTNGTGRVTYALKAAFAVAPTPPAQEDDPVLVDVVASLAAAISLLEHTPSPKKAAPSDKMFEQMLQDYRASLERGRLAIIRPADSKLRKAAEEFVKQYRGELIMEGSEEFENLRAALERK